MNTLRLYSLLAGVLVVGVSGATMWLRRNRKTAEELERERRQRLNQVGRITDGNILGVEEITRDSVGAIQLLLYNYDVGGVQYECSQDVTYLRHFLDLHSCGIGLPASIKYDPQNPGNSIVIAEGWSGLRN